MPGLHVSELGRSWNDLVKNIQRRPFDMFLFAFTTPFAVPAACCVEKRKEAQDWTHEWSFQSFPSESNLGETERPRLAKKSSRHYSENEVPVYVASAVSSVASASLGSHAISHDHDEVPVYVASAVSSVASASLGSHAISHDHDEVPVYVASAVTSAVTSAVAVAPALSRDNSFECCELSPGPVRGVCGECKKVITAKRNVYLAYDVQFCSESCRDRGMDKYASHLSMLLPM